MVRDYNNVIESMRVKYIKSHIFSISENYVEDYFDVSNNILLVRQAPNLSKALYQEGDVIFIPKGHTYKFGNPNAKLTKTHFYQFVALAFEALAFDMTDFFESLSISPFVIKGNPTLKLLLSNLYLESESAWVGKSKMLHYQTEIAVVEIIRHILDKNIFTEQMATNDTYFKDNRIVEMLNYIKLNLSQDLSQKKLAEMMSMSSEYFGAYFKLITGMSLKDHITYLRMEQAVQRLKTSQQSIKTIANEVGFHDVAYFCRRFRQIYGISAMAMRRREESVLPTEIMEDIFDDEELVNEG